MVAAYRVINMLPFVASDREGKHISGNVSPVSSELKSATSAQKLKRETGGEICLGRKGINKQKAIEAFTERSATQKSSRQVFQRPMKVLGAMRSPVTTPFKSSRLTLSPFLRARKSVQTYLISRGNTTSTFSESHGRGCSWLPKAPCVFL